MKEMGEIRENYEHGLLINIERLGDCLTIDEKHQLERSAEDMFAKLAGYLTAGMYADIISIEEFRKLMDEVRRWQFS